MIDPHNITNFNLNKFELEERMLFWVTAAGKNGTVAAKLLHNMIMHIDGYRVGPFEAFRRLNSQDSIATAMKAFGIGCYSNKSRTFWELIHSNLDLKTCSTDDLEKIYGIGRKTSRCFILHTRADAKCAGLDTHMLKYLKAVGIDGVPKTTPSSYMLYSRLEKEVLRLADSLSMSPAEFDLKIWNSYSNKVIKLNL